MFINEIFSDVLVKHVYKNLFIPIIQYSDVGIDPEAEEEMESIQPFGRQAIEEEMELNNEVEQEEDTALQVYLLLRFDMSDVFILV
jgi:hypothetical protein